MYDAEHDKKYNARNTFDIMLIINVSGGFYNEVKSPGHCYDQNSGQAVIAQTNMLSHKFVTKQTEGRRSADAGLYRGQTTKKQAYIGFNSL